MVNASLRGVSLSDAEQALASIWCRVEEYGVAAPQLRFGFRRDGRVTIRFSFSDSAAAYLVLNGLDGWEAAARTPKAPMAGRHRG